MEVLYKVEYLSSPRIGDKSYDAIDGRELANDLEALILEYVTKGYKLQETQAINDRVVNGTDTTGLIVIFKLKE